MEIIIDNKLVQIDEDDLFIIAEYDWKISGNRPVTSINGKTTYLYRLIMGVSLKSEEVDHIDGDTLDCRKHRLRVCTHRQNLCNRKSNKGSSSKYIGVQRTKTGKWMARIKRFDMKKSKYIGTYNTEYEAACARDIAAKEIFGEYANINIKSPLPLIHMSKKETSDSLYQKILSLIDEGYIPAQIDRILNISRGYASKMIKERSNTNEPK